MKGTWNTLVAKCGTFCGRLQLEGVVFLMVEAFTVQKLSIDSSPQQQTGGCKKLMFTTVQSTLWKVDMLKFKFSPGLIFFQNSLFQVMIMNIRQRKIKIELV